jgi:chemotaxis protein methyltransferase CheR
MKLSVEDFIKLRNIIYDRAGIFFETKKLYFITKRLQTRMKALSYNDVDKYCNYLIFKDKFGSEMQQLLNLMTTNETYFFREDDQLKAFMQHSLPEVLDQKRITNNRHLKIWSAGCSSGEEPYTLGILLQESKLNLNPHRLEIVATDINTQILDKAGKGVYDSRSVRLVPPHILAQYFNPIGDRFQLSSQVKEMVQFQHLNLMDTFKMRLMRGFDFIFCRNVFIYFDQTSRKSTLANFYDCLNPGGFIYLGHSESITRISSAFNIKRRGGLIVHQKPGMKEDV